MNATKSYCGRIKLTKVKYNEFNARLTLLLLLFYTIQWKSTRDILILTRLCKFFVTFKFNKKKFNTVEDEKKKGNSFKYKDFPTTREMLL